jgi:stress response protein SCP2
LGDNLTGAGEGDDEQIIVDLAKMPAEYDRIVIVVNIYQAYQRKQHFGLINNAFIRLVDAKTNKEICKYNLSEDYSDMTAMIFGEIYRHNGEWKFNAIGQGTKDPGLGELANRYI